MCHSLSEEDWKHPYKNLKDHDMEAQHVWHFSFMSTWTCVFFFFSVCSGMDKPKLILESTVFVAFTGEGLNITSKLKIPANQTSDVLTCSDPLDQKICSYDISEVKGQPENVQLRLELKNLTSSGEYSCQYKTAKVYWFLRVGSESGEPIMDYTESIVVAVFTGVLLVFSVVGSVCVFRGHGKDCLAGCYNAGRKQKQNREEREEREIGEDNGDVIISSSTSFYASLETRPRSIYDVLDHQAASREPDQSKAKPKEKKPQEMIGQTMQDQHEGVFESVYENF